ncbi:MAG: hypothetical protein AMK73_04795 [Planctomycetes bacterium SM23_32]|nr:MAG: hypothetical protein AMK73_04795 [Planctomycetes bacterium SM23_32]
MCRTAPLLTLFCALCLRVAMPPAAAEQGERPAGVPAYVNGDFELDVDGDGWPDGWTDDAGGRASWAETVDGDRVLRLEGDGQFRTVYQEGPVPAGVSELYVSAMVALEGFERGPNPWDNVRVALVFYDAAGESLTYPMGIGLDADTHWRKADAMVEVPEGAAVARLVVMMHQARGTLRVDDVAVEDAMAGESAVDTAGWIAYGPDTLTTEGTMADMSRLNEKPAGLHGFLKARGDRFWFEDGAGPFRFWGAAMHGGAVFPEKEEAERTARRLAAMGVNCLRLHHLDNAWEPERSLIDYSARTPGGLPTSRVINTDMLDRLHYFMAQCKAAGIYIYLDLITARQFQAGDGCPIYRPGDRGMDGKGVIAHPAVRELVWEFNRRLLTTVNPYTGLAPVEEPAIILSEVINEDELALERAAARDEGPYGEYYHGLFNDWLRRRYGSPLDMLVAWQVPGEESPLLDGEDPADVALAHSYNLAAWSHVQYQRYRPGSEERRFMRRDQDRLRFWDHVQRQAWGEIVGHARSFGYQVPMTGSNMPNEQLHARLANLQLGRWLDDHSYFNPEGWIAWKNEPVRNVNELTVPPASLGLKAMLAPADFPFTLSEWNTSNDVDTCYVHVPHYAFRMAFHGWSGGNHFCYCGGGPPERSGPIDVEQHVGLMGQWPVAALMFRRGDLRMGPRKVIEFPVERIFDFDFHSRGPGGPMPWAGVDGRLSVVENIRTRFVNRPGAPIRMPLLNTRLVDDEGQTLVTSTGEAFWDYGRGALFIKTPRTVWAAGEYGPAVEQLGPVTIALESPGASVAVVSLDDSRRVEDADRLLIMAVARSYATGAVYNRRRTYVKEHGRAPLLGEPVRAEVHIQVPGAQSARVVAYAPDGTEAGVPPHRLEDDVLTVMLGQGPARGFYYGVELQR